MNKRLAMILMLAVLVCQALLAVRATPLRQQQSPPAPTGLALEVTYDKERPPTYQAVPGPDAKLNGSWYSLFGRVPSWQPPAGVLPVKAINVLSRLEGGLVRIEVSVFLGVKHFEKEQAVATYRVSENEQISVDGLTQFGAAPFEIKVVRVNPLSPDPPSIVNKTDSIEVIGVRANNSTLPSYTMTVHNRSSKRVAALVINVMVNGTERLGSMRRRRDGKTFIEAGATEDILLSGAKTTLKTAEGYLPDSPPNQEILISTAVFEDGSYEGEQEPAARFRGFELGSKLQVPKLIALLEEASKSTGPTIWRSLEKLKAQAKALGTAVTEAALLELQGEFPSLGPETKAALKTSVEVALGGEKFEFLKRIEEFEKAAAQSADQNAFRAWLSDSKEKYQKWLAQLQSE